jgi:serine/threonine protein kinase
MGTPAHIADHELVRCIGRGGFGEVWLGRTVIDGYRAIKIIHRSKFEDNKPFDREFAGVRKFEPISRTHPGLVMILQVGRNAEKGYFYYVMEVADDLAGETEIDPSTYVPKTLRQYLMKKGRLPLSEAVEIGIALADALAHIHGKGLVHRDIKPSNIIFVNGAPKLADIGLVTRIEEGTGLGGTLGYIPPEGPGAPTADLFALGKVLYQMAMGKAIEQYPELPVQMDEWEELPQFNQMNQIILRCCELRVDLRMHTALELREALVTLQQALPSKPKAAKPKTTVVGPDGKKTRRQKRSAPAHRLKFRIVILYSAVSEVDRQLLQYLREQLGSIGFEVYYDKREAMSLALSKEIPARIAEAEAIVVLLSATSVQDELLGYQVELAYQAAQQNPKRPRLLPVRVQYTGPLPSAMAGILDPLPALHWTGPATNERLIDDLSRALEESLKTLPVWSPVRLESVGGAMLPNCPFYVVRPTDHEFQLAIGRRDSIVLVKGARQIGKTSLLARGLEQARRSGGQVVLTDFQKFNASHLESLETLYRNLSEYLADQLELDVFAEDSWDKRRGPNTNFERYLKRVVLPAASGHLVWGLDEVDRLFNCPFGSEVFGLFRAWHNERALNPGGPWARLTLVMAYATEAHLFITDLNQSPFNVGTRLTLQDFTLKEAAELNRRYNSPLRSEADLKRLYDLLGGHPYLTRRALNEVAAGNMPLDKLLETADHDDGIFGDHLRRMLVLLAKDPVLTEKLKAVLRGETHSHSDTTAFYRLRSAGIMGGETVGQIRLRCELYARYLRKHLLL